MADFSHRGPFVAWSSRGWPSSHRRLPSSFIGLVVRDLKCMLSKYYIIIVGHQSQPSTCRWRCHRQWRQRTKRRRTVEKRRRRGGRRKPNDFGFFPDENRRRRCAIQKPI
ncbi:hypothetical protein AVEN_164465-1 [Araneus ventricosus]|uniref:Uncharacterized protein n=1 Tax=Araneus ventricosus TaxID=182803 RepID=A0A4Y2Q971_ARAVE|nr:hypothetical protein AVEN_164465-1 [Araneus ventricosus]